MIRAAISSFMMIFGVILAYGIAFFSPDAVAFLSSEASGEMAFLPRYTSLCAEPFVLYYGQGAWFWALFFFGGGLRLYHGIKPNTLVLRILAAHAAAFLLGLSAGFFFGDFSYQTAGVGGVLLGRALTQLMPPYIWLPFTLAFFSFALCFASSLPYSFFYRIQRALRPRPLPVQAPMPDLEEEALAEEETQQNNMQALACENEALPQRNPLPDDGTPSFLRPIEVDFNPKDYEFPKERSAFYEKMRENTLELDETSASKASYRYTVNPETIDETDGESVFKIPAEESGLDTEGGILPLKPRPLTRLSFDAPQEEAAPLIDSKSARRTESIENLETDGTRFILQQPLAQASPASEPLSQIKTFAIDTPMPHILPSPVSASDSTGLLIEENIQEPAQETIIAGVQEPISAENLILPEDYENPAPQTAYAPPAPEFFETLDAETEINPAPITDTDEIREASEENEVFLLDSGEKSLVNQLEARTKEKSKAASALKEKLRRRHEELSKLYFHAGEEPPLPYTPEDIEDYLGEEIASLKASAAHPAPKGYTEPNNEDFFIRVPEDSTQEVPPADASAPEEILPEAPPASLPLAVEVPAEDNQEPVLSTEEAFVFDAVSAEPSEFYSPSLEPLEEAPIIQAPAYSQYDVDNLITLNDKIHVQALLEDAVSLSIAYAKDEVAFSAIRSEFPPEFGGELPEQSQPSPQPAASPWSPAADQYIDKFLESTENLIAEDFSFPQEEPLEGLLSDEDLQIIQGAEEAKEEFIKTPVLEAAEVENNKISINLEDLAQFSNLSPAKEAFSTIAPTAEDIEEMHLEEALISETPLQDIEGLVENPSDEEPAPQALQPYQPADQEDSPQEFSQIQEDDTLAPPEAALMPRVLREEVSNQLPSSIVHPPLIDPVFPSLDELTPNNEVVNLNQEDAEIDEMVRTIEQAFESFNISMKVVDYSRGPAITRFELEPPAGLKLRTIRNLQDDIALQLGTSNIRIISPVEGRSFVGIEVPNNMRRSFLLKEFIEGESFQQSKADLPLILGMDIGANKVCGDLTTLPHLLVAGTTGSGKSVYINALISGLLFKLSPANLKFIMIDPKMVELELYNGIPHLLAPIITKPEEAMAALEWAVQEMDRRYKLLSDNGVRNIKEYTALAKNSFLGEDTWEHLPYIVIIVDEFANLMLRSPKDTEKNISRLAAMARAVGMHLVIATQRPSVDVVTGIIKANFPCRIAFRVSSKIDSRTILDRNGAEALLGKGDMLYISPDYNEAERMQSPFVPGSDVESIVETVKKNGPPNYIIDFEELLSSSEDSDIDGSMTDALSDPMFAEVLRYAVDNGEISASGIQRRFRVGYNRASRLIETLKDQRIIAPPASAGKGWQVLISKDQIVNYLE